MAISLPGVILRNDFLAVEQGEAQEARLTKRACSLPPREKPIDDDLEAATAYVTRLQGSLDRLDNQSGSLETGLGVTEMPSEPLSPPSGVHWPVSAGSRGHPDFCRRPCMFLLRGRCKMGSDCTHCHLDHTTRKKGFHLDKRDREFLQGLTCAVVLSAAIPLVHRHMQDIVAKAETAQACQELGMLQRELCDILEDSLAKAKKASPAEYTEYKEQRVMHMFSKLSVGYMLNCVIRSLRAEDEDAAEALREQMHRITKTVWEDAF
eukprot:TRINITY_DN19332_c0_g1_i1.p1 TRINITY_DN19332_c0_g1~~TRINITY_DN19332_c0_g1_i1.p1  ORF type:complete len:274 (+),score=41.10 TRINITY_DN19332_c0_g1_i1:31-822(+)